MTNLTAKFNTKNFEFFNTTDPYLTSDQLEAVVALEARTNSQLDWLAQLLGWSGSSYWNNLVSSVSQKRNLQTGTFGVYNGYIYPEIVEVRNWENTVIVKKDSRIQLGQVFYLGDNSYNPTQISEVDGTYHISFSGLSEQFYADLASNLQLKVISPLAIPEPFRRTDPFFTASTSFLCVSSGSSLTLYPEYDQSNSVPYRINSLVAGSRYFFDKPLTLESGTVVVNPLYDFTREKWYLDVPLELSSSDMGLEAQLISGVSALDVSILPWVDPTDWLTQDKIDNFQGVWSNKGGRLPYHFAFDALSLHGVDETQSVLLEPVTRSLSFDDLLESVYLQRCKIAPGPPPTNNSVWWNSQTGTFSIFENDPLNCGPWIQIDYPNAPSLPLVPDYVLPDVASFSALYTTIDEGVLVEILDISGLNSTFGIEGLTGSLSGPGVARLYKKENSPYWTIFDITFEDEVDFASNSASIPPNVKVNITDSSGLEGETISYTVSNLSFQITDPYPVVLMKSADTGYWYLSPPSELKYIGNTRLFSSSLDFANPTEGEMNWDFTVSDPSQRMARTFYYNNWVQDPFSSEWYLTGDWIAVNSNSSTSTVPAVVNFGAVLVYCEGELMTAGLTHFTENYQLTYTINSLDGTFDFTYTPLNYEGSISLPKVTISDSLTSAFTWDISDSVFSGLTYYLTPNVADTMALLRVWKKNPLQVIDSLDPLELLRNANPLRADINSGPGSENWERYFFRLPPAYGRNGSEWQKVNLVCQNFGYFGSPVNPENMGAPAILDRPLLYEEAFLDPSTNPETYLYSEPYLVSGFTFSSSGDEVFSPSYMVYEVNEAGSADGYAESRIIEYDPYHDRRANLDLPVGEGYGKWEGSYFRADNCGFLSGFPSNDIESGTMEPIVAPLWDASIYEAPPLPTFNQESGVVDANHFKVGYAFFLADLSSAEEGCFDFSLNG
jgi:hypothetical protein